jgi:Transcription factor WhiB
MTTATASLNTALITMASQGSRPRCADPVDHQLWTSEDQHDRDTAAARCNGCQVLSLCHQAAEEREEKWGVWGGRDRSIRPGRKAA